MIDLTVREKLSDDQYKSATPEDLARAVHQWSIDTKNSHDEVKTGLRSLSEGLEKHEKQIQEIKAMQTALKTQYPPDPLAVPQQVGDYAARKGGLFARGKPVLKYADVLKISPRARVLRGEDSDLVKDLHDANDCVTFKYMVETLKNFNRPNANQLAWEATAAGEDFKRLEGLMEYAGYSKTLIHPESGGIAQPLTYTLVSGTVVDMIRMELRVANLMQQISLPHVNYKLPANRGDAIGVKGGAVNTDPPPTTTITTVVPNIALFGTISFGTIDFDCKDVLAFLWWSDRAVVESAVPLLDYLRGMIVFAHARAIDRACMSGDKATTHMDDYTPNFSSRDARKLWNGLRRLGANFMLDGGSSALDSTDVRNMRAAMGKYGLAPDDLVLWLNTGPLYDIMGDSGVLTMEKFGVEAVIKTGTLAKIDGISLIPTEWIPTDQNTTGYSASGGDKTSAVMANVRRFYLGTYGGISTEVTRWGPMQTTVIQASGYYDFRPAEGTSQADDIFTTGDSGAQVPVSIMRACLN